jgi:hypothetical protein
MNQPAEKRDKQLFLCWESGGCMNSLLASKYALMSDEAKNSVRAIEDGSMQG